MASDARRDEWARSQRKRRERMGAFLDSLRRRPCEVKLRCGPKRYRRELAHVRATDVVGRGRGLERRYFDVLRNPDAYVVACLPCHGYLDRHHRYPGSRKALGLQGTVLCPN